MGRQGAAVAAQEKVPRHASKGPFAQPAVAEGAGDDQIRLDLPGDRG